MTIHVPKQVSPILQSGKLTVLLMEVPTESNVLIEQFFGFESSHYNVKNDGFELKLKISNQ